MSDPTHRSEEEEGRPPGEPRASARAGYHSTRGLTPAALRGASFPQTLVPSARLFGHLLLRELDESMLKQMRRPEVASALAELGVVVPAGETAFEVIEKMGVEYCACFLVGPEHVPLVQSVWEQGANDQQSGQTLTGLAKSAGLRFDKEQARSAPVDHLGSILLLWAELADDWPEASEYVVQRHLSWARAPLRRLAHRPGFYGQLAQATLELIDVIQS